MIFFPFSVSSIDYNYDSSLYENYDKSLYGDYEDYSNYGDTLNGSTPDYYYKDAYPSYGEATSDPKKTEEYCLSFLFTARILFSGNGNPLLGLTLGPSAGRYLYQNDLKLPIYWIF